MGAALSAALSAIDVALWDIAGQAVGQPVHQLLGGRVRDKIKVFANVNGATVDECAASAQEQVGAGYISLRMSPFMPGFERKTPSNVIGDAIAMVASVREAVGYNIDLGLEIHRNLRPEEAITLSRELLPFRLLYYEDPLAPESLEAMEYIAKAVPLPMATGERFYNIFQFKDLIDRKIVRSHPARPLPCRRLYPGQEDRGHRRIRICRHIPPPDGQPRQHCRLLPARRIDTQLRPDGEPSFCRCFQ